MSANLNEQPGNRIITYLALLALLGLGAWLRARFIHTVQLYPDEFVTLLAVRMISEKGLPVMPSGLFFDHGLLFSYAGSVAALFGPARLAVRYASLLFGLLTLGFTFWIGRRWFTPAVGLLATTGLVIAPTAIHWGGRARMYTLLQLLVMLTLWLAYEGVVHDKANWRWTALLAYLGATLAHFLAVALAPPLVLAVILLYWLKIRESEPGRSSLRALISALCQRWRWLETIAFGFILIIAFLVKRAGQPKGVEVLEVANVVSGLGQVLTIYSDLSFNLVEGWHAIAPFFLNLPALLYTPFALLAIVLSLKTVPGRSRRESGSGSGRDPTLAAFFLSVILLTATIEMIFLVSPDRRDDKYLFMLLPVLFLLGSWGMVSVGRQLLNVSGEWLRGNSTVSIVPMVSIVSLLLVCGLIISSARPKVRQLLANTGDDYDSAFAYLQDHWQPGDTILSATPAAAAFYLGHNDFYSVQRRGGYDYRILTVGGQHVDRWLASPAIRTEAALHRTLADHKVWLVLERWGLQREYYDLPFLQQLLAQTEHVSESQGIFILRSKTNPQPLALEAVQTVEAIFGERIRLTGYTIEPERPGPGQVVRLTLYWQALAPMSQDYTVFVHLRQPQGANVAQADHRPLGSLYPTSLWPVGETIRETSQLLVPPALWPGSYELWVGLYLLETGARLPLQNDLGGENAFRLGTLTVQ